MIFPDEHVDNSGVEYGKFQSCPGCGRKSRRWRGIRRRWTSYSDGSTWSLNWTHPYGWKIVSANLPDKGGYSDVVCSRECAIIALKQYAESL